MGFFDWLENDNETPPEGVTENETRNEDAEFDVNVRYPVEGNENGVDPYGYYSPPESFDVDEDIDSRTDE